MNRQTIIEKNNVDMYMNPFTGSVDTLDGWYPYGPDDGLVLVVRDESGEWVAA